MSQLTDCNRWITLILSYSASLRPPPWMELTASVCLRRHLEVLHVSYTFVQSAGAIQQVCCEDMMWRRDSSQPGKCVQVNMTPNIFILISFYHILCSVLKHFTGYEDVGFQLNPVINKYAANFLPASGCILPPPPSLALMSNHDFWKLKLSNEVCSKVLQKLYGSKTTSSLTLWSTGGQWCDHSTRVVLCCIKLKVLHLSKLFQDNNNNCLHITRVLICHAQQQNSSAKPHKNVSVCASVGILWALCRMCIKRFHFQKEMDWRGLCRQFQTWFLLQSFHDAKTGRSPNTSQSF